MTTSHLLLTPIKVSVLIRELGIVEAGWLAPDLKIRTVNYESQLRVSPCSGNLCNGWYYDYDLTIGDDWTTCLESRSIYLPSTGGGFSRYPFVTRSASELLSIFRKYGHLDYDFQSIYSYWQRYGLFKSSYEPDLE